MKVTFTTTTRLLAASGLSREEQAGARIFENAAWYARRARELRKTKAAALQGAYSPARCEAAARTCERRVREIALQSEIVLARRMEGGAA